MGRTATGVIGMRLDDDGEDYIVGMICMDSNSEDTILVVSEQGYGKRTRLNDEDGNPFTELPTEGGKALKH